MSLPRRVYVCDVAPRDGLQNEATPVSTATKIELIHRLQQAGCQDLETTSYVSPKWVPQMADHHAVMQGLSRQAGVRYAVLTPNWQGWQAAIQDHPDAIVVFASASQTFSQRNINCSIETSIERFAPVVAAAQQAGIQVRAAMSCTVGCPYEGEIAPQQVRYLAGLLKEIGVGSVSVADTIGVGTPNKIQAAIEATMTHFDVDHIAGHFHDTYGMALANTYAAWQMGVYQFDSSVAGLGGCPYAKGATGNVATEDMVYMFHGMGVETGLDLAALVETAHWISGVLGRPVASRVARAWRKS